MELASGVVLAGRYRLEHLLGEGGMGVVWLATHTLTSKRVALKVLREGQVSDPKLRARFLREARAASVVQHPNIVEIHDVIELEDGTPIMVMEYLEGETLGSRLAREGPIRLSDLAQIMLPVCSAVGAAHKAGIVHRDLKPDNVFIARALTGQAQVKVLDFGIAKLTAVDGASTANLTGTGAMLGTPYYMAPEQIFGEKDIDLRVDVWALGIILYECLTGVRPTEGENVGQIMKMVTTGRIKPIETVSPNQPKEICELLKIALSVDRDGRPKDVDVIAKILSRYVIEGQVLSPPVSAPRVSLTEVGGRKKIATPEGADELSKTVQSGERSIAGTLSASTTDKKQEPSRSRARYFIAAAVIAAAITPIAFYAARKNHTDVAVPEPAPSAPQIATTIVPPSSASIAPRIEETSQSTASATAAASSTQKVKPPIKPKPSETSAPASGSVNYGGVIEKPPF